ncbi:unnamed protein product [Cyclocybe aegerita]|uniref:Uncharacterized protein n=1 Tax=Cyclocybe aegerita TaxID=1973307 RepID=A0A8S0WVH3_CYCAE|nr:unnamed protein product [Cyclocybe aegerita]
MHKNASPIISDASPMSSTSTQAPKVLAPPQIACGYHTNMPYLQGFLKRTPADEVEQGLAVLAVVGWWLDLPLDQRRSAPQPYTLLRTTTTLFSSRESRLLEHRKMSRINSRNWSQTEPNAPSLLKAYAQRRRNRLSLIGCRCRSR